MVQTLRQIIPNCITVGRKVINRAPVVKSAAATKPIMCADCFTRTQQSIKNTALNETIKTAAIPSSVKIKAIQPATNSSKIRIAISENGRERTIEAPKYLYHITSTENYKKIVDSGVLKITEDDQVRGIFLLDAENFVSLYPSFKSTGGQKIDLVNSLFNQITKHKLRDNQVKLLRIPTESLIRNGKLLIRKQSDFFEYQNDKLFDLYKQLKKKNIDVQCTVRSLADDAQRMKFRQAVIDNKIMTEKEIDVLLADMTQKLHRGYNFFDCETLSQHNAIEYVFNKSLSLANFKEMGIGQKTININEFLNYEDCIIPEKLKRVF